MCIPVNGMVQYQLNFANKKSVMEYNKLTTNYTIIYVHYMY